MNKLRLAAILLAVFAIPHFVFAQNTDEQIPEEPLVESTNPESTTEGQVSLQPELKAVAGEDQSVGVSRKVVLDASKSVVPADSEVRFVWDLGDGNIKEGVDVIHEYEKPGFYQVELTIDSGDRVDTDKVIVSVYEDLIVLVTDNEAPADEVAGLKRYAARQGVLLVTIQSEDAETETIVEAELVNKLIDAQQDVKKADVIIVWTKSANFGLSILSSYGRKAEGKLSDLDFERKGIVAISSQGLNALGRIAQSTFDVLGSEYIFLTRASALETIIDARTSDRAVAEVQSVGFENALIGTHSERAVKDLGVTNFMSYTMNVLINNGVAIETVTLLLFLPIVATLIAIARQIFGVKFLGIYIPTLISLTLVATGIKYGLFIFVVLIVAATLIRVVLKRFRLFYLPRMALLLSILALVIIGLFILGATTNRTGIIELSIFPILILVILVEKFIEVQIEKGYAEALRLSLETIVIAVVCYYIINWEFLKVFIIAYPEAVLLTIPINIAVGKWMGLRISEYFRFRELRQFINRSKS